MERAHDRGLLWRSLAAGARQQWQRLPVPRMVEVLVAAAEVASVVMAAVAVVAAAAVVCVVMAAGVVLLVVADVALLEPALASPPCVMKPELCARCRQRDQNLTRVLR